MCVCISSWFSVRKRGMKDKSVRMRSCILLRKP